MINPLLFWRSSNEDNAYQIYNTQTIFGYTPVLTS